MEALDEQTLYDSEDAKRKESFRFAIVFNGFLDPGMLQTGNWFVLVGAADRASSEAIGWMQSVLPHLLGQCLHIWKIDEGELNRFPYGDTAELPSGRTNLLSRRKQAEFTIHRQPG